MLYEDPGEMVEYLAQALKQTSREATILLYALALDPHPQKMADLATGCSASMRSGQLRPKPGRPRRGCREPRPRWGAYS